MREWHQIALFNVSSSAGSYGVQGISTSVVAGSYSQPFFYSYFHIFLNNELKKKKVQKCKKRNVLGAGNLAKWSGYSHQQYLFLSFCTRINTKEGSLRTYNRHKVLKVGSNQVIIMQTQCNSRRELLKHTDWKRGGRERERAREQ